MKRITSRHNPIVARFRAAGQGTAADLLLLDGVHLVTDALDAGLRLRQAAVTADGLARPDLRAIVERLQRAEVEVVTATPAVMDLLSPVRSSSAIVAIADRPIHDDGRLYSGGHALVIIASDVQDPGNVGAIVRVAEAAGATGVVAAGACADPYGWKALRGSMGSSLRLPVAVRDHVDQAVAQARRHGCRIVATVPHSGRAFVEVNLQAPTAVLIGGEGAGLAAPLVQAADERITIPMQAPVESLNAAVTAALILYEARRQRGGEATSRATGTTQNAERRT